MLESILDAIMPNVLEIIVTIISLIVARYVIPYIKTDLIPWLKEKHLYNIVKSFVQAVEKMAESGVIKKVDKKTKVVELLQSKGIVVDAVVDAFIENGEKEIAGILKEYDGNVITIEDEDENTILINQNDEIKEENFIPQE